MSQAQDPRLVPLRDSLAGLVLRGTGNVSYYLRERIGEGGQGWVFRANWDDPAGLVVIVKVLRPDVVATEALERFKREAEVLQKLSTQGRPNPHIVRFFDHAVAQVRSPYGPEPLTLPFTVLEYVNGTTLEKVLADHKGRGLPVERVRRVLRQISQALDVVHEQKVVHRDLKPSNILLATEAGTEIAKVTDFGLVKLVDVNLQRTAALAGASLGYAPPEQYEQGNKRVSPRTDVFSLAAVAYEMLSGKPAFPFNEGENPLLIVTRILNGARPKLMKVRDFLAPELATRTDLVEALDAELGKALSADPTHRHDSIMAFWSAIEPSLKAALAPEDQSYRGPRDAISGFEATAKVQHSEAQPQGGSGVQIRMPGSVAPAASSGRDAPSGGMRTAEVPALSRPPEAQASSPAAWQWAVLTTPLAPQSIRAAWFAPSGDAAVAMTSSGILRWERGAWIPMPPIHGFAPSAVRGVRGLPGGAALVFGEGGLVARVAVGSRPEVWAVPDREITFHGALAEDDGTTTLVGERPYRGVAARSVPGSTAGVVAQFSGDRVTVMGDAINCTRLRAVARLAGGPLVACGDWGTIVRVELGVVEHVGSICGGHLLAIAPMDDGGAVTVGVGGHALSLSAKLDAQLEAVQTTQNLLSVATTDDGQAWAGSANARLLRRSPSHGGGSWVRMSGDIGVTSSMTALHAASRSLRAIGDDGAVVEGRIA
jgi:serine/threonine-protein kinase